MKVEDLFLLKGIRPFKFHKYQDENTTAIITAQIPILIFCLKIRLF